MSEISESTGRRRATLLFSVCLAVAALVLPAPALAMLSRFGDQPMTIGTGGRSLVVDGPVDWELDETRAIFLIVVRQGPVIAIGVRQQVRPSESWNVPTRVLGPARLVPGSALGFGTALVFRADGALTTRTWSGPITLR